MSQASGRLDSITVWRSTRDWVSVAGQTPGECRGMSRNVDSVDVVMQSEYVQRFAPDIAPWVRRIRNRRQERLSLPAAAVVARQQRCARERVWVVGWPWAASDGPVDVSRRQEFGWCDVDVLLCSPELSVALSPKQWKQHTMPIGC
ncbi:uncharacterized protein SPSK_05654 [Sporothrix schenckii 1099-18]|uniref:Uncharacterized protein n=1 Tax=Sporothrix schenckii 1099-18 TaxID=1397361 RepID=A0A0F2LTU4_SPOSC|nr:uncharacterized protein SPSK_05654 [Sporothrix schenckii 1099-18]KJR80902.1 hypothetical protein SPSK_05654 [Sporothrix schenckii 1099-18]